MGLGGDIQEAPMTASGEELLPCPFCRDRPNWNYQDGSDYTYIGCPTCLYSFGAENQTEAFKKWNTRIPSAHGEQQEGSHE